MQDLDHLAGELLPVHDELPQAFGVENHMHGVVREALFHVVGFMKRLEQAPRGLIADAHIPMPIDDDSGIRLLLPQNEIQRLADVLQIVGRQTAVA